jgi:drug/metabolite transporter (DMT)-like permease
MKLLYPIVAAILFSGAFVAAKYTTFDLLPITTTFLRYSVALLFLLAIYLKSKHLLLKIRGKDLMYVVLAGLTGIVGYHFFFFSSLKYTAVTNTAVINAFNPVLTGFFAAIFLKEKLKTINYFGILISLAGVIFLISRGNLQTIINMDFNIGDLMMLTAVVFWVIYSLIIKKIISRYNSFTLTFYTTSAAVVILAVPAFAEGLTSQLASISTESIWGVIYMGIFSSGIAYLLYNTGIKEIGPTKMASVTYSCVPVFTACLSFLFFEEKLTAVLLVSLALIVLGLNGVLRVKRK